MFGIKLRVRIFILLVLILVVVWRAKNQRDARMNATIPQPSPVPAAPK
jgi:hypothetical protein